MLSAWFCCFNKCFILVYLTPGPNRREAIVQTNDDRAPSCMLYWAIKATINAHILKSIGDNFEMISYIIDSKDLPEVVDYLLLLFACVKNSM